MSASEDGRLSSLQVIPSVERGRRTSQVKTSTAGVTFIVFVAVLLFARWVFAKGYYFTDDFTYLSANHVRLDGAYLRSPEFGHFMRGSRSCTGSSRTSPPSTEDARVGLSER